MLRASLPAKGPSILLKEECEVDGEKEDVLLPALLALYGKHREWGERNGDSNPAARLEILALTGETRLKGFKPAGVGEVVAGLNVESREEEVLWRAGDGVAGEGAAVIEEA